jgi:hypothetical protein
MPDTLLPTDVVAAEAALRPVADFDWSVQAGPLEWDVGQTVTHMIGATGFAPPADLCGRVLAQQFPDAAGSPEDDADPWRSLLAATGRPPTIRVQY